MNEPEGVKVHVSHLQITFSQPSESERRRYWWYCVGKSEASRMFGEVDLSWVLCDTLTLLNKWSPTEWNKWQAAAAGEWINRWKRERERVVLLCLCCFVRVNVEEWRQCTCFSPLTHTSQSRIVLVPTKYCCVRMIRWTDHSFNISSSTLLKRRWIVITKRVGAAILGRPS